MAGATLFLPGQPRQSAISHAYSMSMSFVTLLRAWLMLRMDLAALFGKCRSSFVARRPNLDNLHSLRQLARAHQLLETFITCKSLESSLLPVTTVPPCGCYQVRVLGCCMGARGGPCSSPPVHQGVDHCVFSCNDSSRKLRKEIAQYLVDTTSFHLVHFISREHVGRPLD